jgi:Glycosyl transferase family 11
VVAQEQSSLTRKASVPKGGFEEIVMEIVVRQISGLGNQMFQYAAGRYYAKRYGAQMCVAVDDERRAYSYGIPRPFLLSKFAITAPIRELHRFDRFVLLMLSRRIGPLSPISLSVVRSLFGIQLFSEGANQRYTFLPDIPLMDGIKTLYLVGYWQVQNLISENETDLRKEFCFREPPTEKNLATLEQINSCVNPVSIHVRLGDYTLAAEGNVALKIDYYVRAIKEIRERFQDPTFFVFSDDIISAKQRLPQDLGAIYVDNNDFHSAHEDMRLMSSCSHHIIANSTFSWWGAWLNPRKDKVVYAPKDWLVGGTSHHPDLYPSSWTLLSDAPL